jgi:hypothetical protein
MEGDRRSYRVALVADRFVNPSPGGLDAIAVLLDSDWGAIQLPADRYPEEVATALLEQVAEQTEEFHRRGYDIVVIGGHPGLDRALTSVGVPQPDLIDAATAEELRDFLRLRPPPRAATLAGDRPGDLEQVGHDQVLSGEPHVEGVG